MGLRHVIKNADGRYYTHCDAPSQRDVIEKDGHGNKSVHARDELVPKFEALKPIQASIYLTEQDCKDMMAHPFLVDSNAFAGCTVEAFDPVP